ncbi:MAG: ATP-binding protein [Thermoplasmatota archaeon]
MSQDEIKPLNFESDEPELISMDRRGMEEYIFEVDADGNFMKVPRILEEITGFTRDELDLLSLQSVTFVEDRQKVRKAIERISRGEPMVIQELEIFSEGKGSHPIQMIMLPGNEDQAERSVWGAVLDVGDRVELLEKLRNIEESQDRSKTMLSDFVSLLSREIRQPLTSMLLTLEMMDSGFYGEIPKESREKIEDLVRMVDRLKDILNDALKMSDNMKEDFDLEHTSISLGGVIDEVISHKAEVMEKRKIGIERSYPVLDISVVGDRKAIHQVLDSLLEISIGNSPTGGQINVELEVIGDMAQFTISDSGDGIPEGELDRIFDKFHIDSDMERKALTDGMNLYISKRIIQRHGGKIWCESFVGLGTSFLFTLPVHHNQGGQDR